MKILDRQRVCQLEGDLRDTTIINTRLSLIDIALEQQADLTEAEIRSQVAREIFKKLEKYDGSKCKACKYDNEECNSHIFAKNCFWYQSLKKEYGIEE